MANPHGTMRDSVNPAFAKDPDDELETTREEVEANGQVQEDEIEDEEEEKEEEEILDEHEPDREVKLRNREGVITTYVVKEMDGAGMSNWIKKWSSRANKKGSETSKEFMGFLNVLICQCVYGPDGNKISPVKANSLGHRARFKLFSVAQEVNGLTDKVTQREGKD